MTSGAILDRPEHTSATVGEAPSSSFSFSDATIGRVFYPPPRPPGVEIQTAQLGDRQVITALRLSTSLTVSRGTRLQETARTINELLLRDHDGADPTDIRIAIRALQLITPAICEDQPEVFPLSDGGLLFRWQSDGWSAEVEFDSEGDAIVMIDDHRGSRRANYAPVLWGELIRRLRQG